MSDDGEIRSNSDPVTGQGAWFDTRVKIEKAADQSNDETAPLFDQVKAHTKYDRPDTLRYGFEKNMTFEEYERSLGTKKELAK